MPVDRKTQDGYSWTKAAGVRPGNLRCRGVVEPPQKITTPAGHVYDAIIIGAGYAGLMAARDMAERGLSVLMLEARDRIGGRTYTVEEDGILYEMGGTWVTHHMAYLFKEMVRYKMDRNLLLTQNHGYENDYYTINVPGVPPRKLTHTEAGQITGRAWDIFVNVDGQNCRRVCPLPHAQLDNVHITREEVERLDKISCHERFEEIKDQLTPEEFGLLVALLLHISGGSMENSSLWDMIRSHALMSYSAQNFGPLWTTYKLRDGQSELAKRMFDDAVRHKLQYSFRTPIKAVRDTGSGSGLVEVHLKSAFAEENIYRARRVICTIPLNVLSSITFTPALSPLRQEALELGHVNFMNKIHAEVEGSGLASWNGMRYPSVLMFGYGDGVTENGNAHIVGFGKDERGTYVPERDPDKTLVAFQELHPMEVRKMIFHDWVTDPYALGGPAWWRPGYMTKYQDELQSRHGNVLFASADWARGWRAAIDGALEQGCLAAQEVVEEFRSPGKARF